MRRRTRLLSWLLFLLLVSPRPASATIFTWNAGSGNTNASVNWNPAALPGANDDTRFWQAGITYGITTVSPVDTFSTLSASSASTLKFFAGDPIRVRNGFQVDGGVTASVLSGMARAGWFTIGPGSLSISGNGIQAIATNPSATSYIGTTSGFTSTLSVGGGASFSGFNIQVPEIQGATGVLNITGRVIGGPVSKLRAMDWAGAQGVLDVGRQGSGDVELSAQANITTDHNLILGSSGTGKLHLFRGAGTAQGPPSLTVLGTTFIGDNETAGSMGGQGTLAVDVGYADFATGVLMGDVDGGAPDTLRNIGGTILVDHGLHESHNSPSILDLQGGSLRVIATSQAADLYQFTPLSLTGAGSGPVLTIYGEGGASSYLATPGATALIVGRNGGGTFELVSSPFALDGYDLNVSGNVIVADSTSGSGIVSADTLGDLKITGALTVGPGNGLVRMRDYGHVSTTGPVSLLAGPSTGASMNLSSFSALDAPALSIGGTADTPTPGPATVLILTGSRMSIGTGGLQIWGGGPSLDVYGGMLYADTMDCRGTIKIGYGSIFSNVANGMLHLSHGGVLRGVGTVDGWVRLDDASDTLGVFAADSLSDTLWVGDSQVPDAFLSNGTVRIDQGVVALRNKLGAPLGHVLLNGGTLYLPDGGRVRPGDVLEGGGRITGSLTDDGEVSAAGQNIDLAGHLTVGAGDVTGNGLNVLPAGQLSAHGTLSGLFAMAGKWDMGDSLARLECKRGPIMQPTAVLTMRIGSKAHGVQDTLVVDDGLTLAGTLDLRTWKADPPLPGDTLTLITAPFVQGTFSAVTIDGANAPSYVEAIYGPTTVRVVVHQTTTTDVPPPAPAAGGRTLRFVAAGTLRDPSLALELPQAADVEVSLYSAAGRRVAELEHGHLGPGKYSFPVEGGPGVFFARAWVKEPSGRHALDARVVRIR